MLAGNLSALEQREPMSFERMASALFDLNNVFFETHLFGYLDYPFFNTSSPSISKG